MLFAFNKATILFGVTNIVRLLSVISICLVLAGQILVMVNDIKGTKLYTDSLVSAPIASSTARAGNAIVTYTTSSAVSSPTRATGPPMGINTRHRRAKRQYNLPVVSPSSSSRIPTSTSTPTAATTQSTVGIAKPEAAGISCSYIGNTGVPDQLGGVVFSTLAAVLNCLVLLLALLSELPPPSSIVQRFWSYVLPSFGESAGVGGVGAAQIYVASVFLSHSVEGFPLVGAWMCMSMGVVNLLFGLALSSSIKTYRSLIPFAPFNPPSSLSRSKSQQGAYYAYEPERSAGTNLGGKGISAPKPLVMRGEAMGLRGKLERNGSAPEYRIR